MNDRPIMGVVHPDAVPREPKSSGLNERDLQQLERVFRERVQESPSGTFWAIKRVSIDISLTGTAYHTWRAFVVDAHGQLVRPVRMLGDTTTFNDDDEAAKVNAERDGYESGLPRWSGK